MQAVRAVLPAYVSGFRTIAAAGVAPDILCVPG
jgi:hypothetical protein